MSKRIDFVKSLKDITETDLQARIQVALFNILEEGDVQIRGFKLRLPLDILFVFTANPEDYPNPPPPGVEPGRFFLRG